MPDDSDRELLESIAEATVEALHVAETKLPDDVLERLERALEEEEDDHARMMLEAILENVRIAEEKGLPMCQDTGLITVFAEIGREFPLRLAGTIRDGIEEGIRRATEEIPLRPNVVHPISRENTGDNTGDRVPIVRFLPTKGEELRLHFLPKGFGSENSSAVTRLLPTEGLEGVREFVIKTVREAGGMPCPPIVLGVGVGGTIDEAAHLAKLALFRPLNVRNPDPEIAKLEEELLEDINRLGVGPMGLGGRTTALAVNVELAYTHTAGLPVAVNVQCWAARRATAIVYPDGFFEVTQREYPRG
ncbi:fumarate hydratase [Methanopyrus kandleri]